MEANGQYQQVLAAFGKNDMPTVIKLADQLVQHASAHRLRRTGAAGRGAHAGGEQSAAGCARSPAKGAIGAPPIRSCAWWCACASRASRSSKTAIDDALKTLSAVDPGAFAGRFAEVRGDALRAKGDRAGALKAYREAQASQSAQAGAAAGDLLALKINELTRS